MITDGARLMILTHDRVGPRRWLALVVLASLVGVARPALADRVEDLARTLATDHEEKARIRATVALGNLHDPRGVIALMDALDDESAVVRGLAAQALGHLGDGRAIPALQAVLAGDGNDGVRIRAREALRNLMARKPATATTTTSDPTTTSTTQARLPIDAEYEEEEPEVAPRLYVVVKGMGNKSAIPDRELARRMRETVVSELERAPEVTLDEDVGKALRQFVVDGAVSRISRGTNGPWMEVSCEVKLTVSSAEGRLMSIVTGTATVQIPRGTFRASMEKNMQVEAVQSAVRGAHQNLHGFLSRQVQ